MLILQNEKVITCKCTFKKLISGFSQHFFHCLRLRDCSVEQIEINTIRLLKKHDCRQKVQNKAHISFFKFNFRLFTSTNCVIERNFAFLQFGTECGHLTLCQSILQNEKFFIKICDLEIGTIYEKFFELKICAFEMANSKS